MTPRPVHAPVSNTSAADVRAELARWRAVDRTRTPDTAEWWDATLRLRDIADAADREARA